MLTKKKKTAKPQNANNYLFFDDFIEYMLNCSEEQFQSTFNWLSDMRKSNNKMKEGKSREQEI